MTDEQLAAIEATGDRVGVIAGAGTGKTRVITARVRHLIDSGTDPARIAIITFTNRAATELKERLGSGCSVFCGTFHSIALSLMSPCPTVLSQADAEQVLLECARLIGDKRGVSALRRAIEQDSDLGKVYRSRLRELGATDFDGLITHLGDSVDKGRFSVDHVLIDEAQDTDARQWAVVDALVSKGAKLFAVGDPKQQLYEWRGSRSEDFLNRVDVKFFLTKTWRLPPAVAEIHNTLAKECGLDEPLYSQKAGGAAILTAMPIHEVVADLLGGDDYWEDDIAVLCRSNRMVSEVSKKLRECGYAVHEGRRKLSESPWIRLLGYIENPTQASPQVREFCRRHFTATVNGAPLHFLHSKSDDFCRSITRVWLQTEFVVPTVGAVMGRLIESVVNIDQGQRQEARAIQDEYYSRRLRDALNDITLRAGEAEKQPASITVCTVHQAKGLEWPAVVAVTERGHQNAEELRIALVQATRAIDRLVIVDQQRNPGPLARAARKSCSLFCL